MDPLKIDAPEMSAPKNEWLEYHMNCLHFRLLSVCGWILCKKSFLILQLIVVAFLWGGTNPLIKRGSQGIEHAGSNENNIKKFFKEIVFLLLNWKYILPFGLNQLGSVLFFFLLQKNDLNVIVPVTNSLSYSFTSIVGYLIGESKPDFKTVLGIILITAGTTCFVISNGLSVNDSNCQS